MTRRRDPNSWTVVRLPERDLAELILELAAPLLDRLGPTQTIEDARGALDLAVMFWNASVLDRSRQAPGHSSGRAGGRKLNRSSAPLAFSIAMIGGLPRASAATPTARF